jgi:hypothetical protein
MMNFIQISGIMSGVTARPRDRRGGARPGAGRPPIFEDKVRVAFDMERDDYEALREIAERWDESVPAVIRRALGTLLKRHRK